MRDSATLLIHCPDRKGLVAAISSFLFAHGANILHADQHQDNELGLFFMRVEWSLADFDLDDQDFRSDGSSPAGRVRFGRYLSGGIRVTGLPRQRASVYILTSWAG